MAEASDRRRRNGGGGLGGILIPLLLNTIGLRGVIILAVVYFALKMFTGVDLINMVNGGGGGVAMPQTSTMVQPNQKAAQVGNIANGQTAASDPGKQFVAKVLNSTDEVWTKIFADMGKQYVKPTLVLFSNYDQSGCGTAQSAQGPFYCPADSKVYIDLAFYQELKDKFGAPGEFAQAYVIAHEVGHHVQHLLGITDQVDGQKFKVSKTAANQMSVRVELQADCFAGIWGQEAGVYSHVQIENGDIEQALNAASQSNIGPAARAIAASW